MNDVIINVSRETNMVYLDNSVIGVDGENLQKKLVFKFTDNFVHGVARLEYQMNDEKQFIFLTREDECYTLPIKNVLTKKGRIDLQLVITEDKIEDSIPVFKSNIFYLYVGKSINAVGEAPDGYADWIALSTEKILEIEEAIEKSKEVSEITKQQGEYAKEQGDYARETTDGIVSDIDEAFVRFENAEAKRVADEIIRNNNEDIRKEQENVRNQNEEQRIIHENERELTFSQYEKVIEDMEKRLAEFESFDYLVKE